MRGMVVSRYIFKAAEVPDPESFYWAEACRREYLVDDHEPKATGILDQYGREIMRLPNPIGFGRNDEW